MISLRLAAEAEQLKKLNKDVAAKQLDPIVSPAEQSEAITTHQIVTSVLIFPSAQITETLALTSNFTNNTKQPSQRKSVFPLVDIGVIGNTYRTCNIVKLIIVSYQIPINTVFGSKLIFIFSSKNKLHKMLVYT